MFKKRDQKEQHSEIRSEIPIPPALQKRFIKQMLASACVAVMTIIFLFYYKRWEICFGFILTLFIVWMGFDTIWRFQKGDIVCKQMVCIKATRLLKQDRVYAVMRDLEYDGDPEKSVHHYYIPTSKKEANLIDTNVILNCYVAKNNTAELITWEIIGNAT